MRREASNKSTGNRALAAFALLLVALPVAAAALSAEPHQAAHNCLQKFSGECATVCLLCHRSPEESPLEYLELTSKDGDTALCGQCHEEKLVVETANRYMLNNLPAGNHPSNVPYDADKPGYASSPEGPKIFCNENRTRCTVQCSSCHDPHAISRDLLRVNNAGSKLCFSCHHK